MAKAWSDSGRIMTTIPDLFKSFIKSEPLVRPDYGHSKTETCTWLSPRLAFDEKAKQKLIAGDFTWFCTVYISLEPSYDRFRIVSDWTNLIFYLDDLFDNGDLKDDPVRTKSFINRLFEAIDGEIEPTRLEDVPKLSYVDRVQAAHDEFWQRFRSFASPLQQKFYRRAMVKFLKGALKQVQDCKEEYGRSLDEILERRRDSVGMDPCYPLLWFAHDLNIPDEVAECAAVEELEQLACELCGLQNDVVSYRKEEMSCPLSPVCSVD